MNDHELAGGMASTPGYRYAEVVGRQLILAGQVPLDGEGVLVGLGDAAAQTGRCLHNLETLIDLHGFDVSHIRHITIYVVGDDDDLSRAWAKVVDWFGGETPPATLLGVSRLGHDNQLVEVDTTIIK